MSFKYTLKTALIMDGETEVATVRGLSFTDIVQLLQVNREAMERLYAEFAGRDPNSIGEGEVTAIGMQMVEKAPALAGHIIALAADAPESFDDIIAMPVGLQIACLEKIGELTFTSGGGLKKTLALAMKAMSGASQSASPAR